jgi:hypothetical protein
MTPFETVPIDSMHTALSLRDPVNLPESWRNVPLSQWSMDADDIILRQVFRQVRPLRHLEFGTWMGDGVLRCVEECDATVWTVNVLEGEKKPNGEWAYGALADEGLAGETAWSERLQTEQGLWIRTDSYGLIGRKYLQAGWGKRVCQIYADTRQWDTRAYPDGFFDTVFVDGGHRADIVKNDTALAVRLVRPGGLVIWHDFCPKVDVTEACRSTRDVVRYLTTAAADLEQHFEKLVWVNPSWLLFGVRRP